MAPSLHLLLGAAAYAAVVRADSFTLPPGYHRYAPRSQGINWAPCEGNETLDCTRFEVPLDWHDETAGKASLAVARYRATKQPKIGTLFVNPGGPGGSGVDMILGGADDVMSAAGGQYDIVSWDPRGVGKTVPRADCFSSGTEENSFWEETIPRAGLEARGNFTDQRDLDAFYAQVPEVDKLLAELGERCLAYSPNTFQYIGSAAAVRDMVAMHDILEGPEKPVDYWGLSYGTIIGIYFVNMFPDRVGRVVIDGVLDPVYWANKPAYEMWGVKTESTDEAFTGFVSACAAAGPAGCALAQKGSTADSLRQGIRDLLNAAYDYRRSVGPTAEVTSSAIRGKLYLGMYTPTRWPQLAQDLAELNAAFSNLTSSTPLKARSLQPMDSALRNRQTSNSSSEDPAPDYAFQAVTCGDAMDAGNTTTKDVFDFLVYVTQTVSQMFGPWWGDAGLYCHQWPVRAVERYSGPWNKQLSNSILVIGNEADPVTPYISAKRVADALGDSAILVEQDDYGHLSLAMHSSCTTAIIQNYFLHNQLPSADQFCGTNQVLFPGPGVTKQSLNSLSASGSGSGSIGGADINAELESTRQRARNLFIAVVALAAAVALLLVGLIISCVRSRKQKPSYPAYISRGVFDKAAEDQGHTYDNPFNPTANSEKGGYSRVQT
ncbi:hypothetical protein FRC09_007499 [Ceratobasidium sp. 395]|nr:hypothetical protein FRC09_007499 [Ceratobasidium sp. 395]